MNKIKQSWHRVINSASDIRVLEANPIAGTPPVIGNGTSFDLFTAWTATNFCKIHPFADSFSASQLVSFEKQSVKANATPFSTGSPAPFDGKDFDVTTTVGIAQNPDTIVTITSASQERGQIIDVTVGTLPLAGSKVIVRLVYTDITRDATDFIQGNIVKLIDFTILATDTPTIVATRIRERLKELANSEYGSRNLYLDRMNVTSTGAVVTIDFGRPNFTFDIYTLPIDSSNGQTELPVTKAFNTTVYGGRSAKPFSGVLNYKWMQRHVQTNSGRFDQNDGTTKFLPIDGVYYVQYNIVYRHESTDENQPHTINAVQQHNVEIELFVHPSLTAVIAQLDAIGV